MGRFISVASLAASGINSKHEQLGLPVKHSQEQVV